MVLASNENLKQPDTPSIRTRTPLALDGGTKAEIVSFYNLSEAGEHVALIFSQRDSKTTPLVRLHSECLTGDVFGSAHCDCGDQLREAKSRFGDEGGILLYLRQEGRGIGLYNKLDAYKIQEEHGLNTFEANKHIGFEEDERSFKIAAEMLSALDISNIRILTNNPDKVSQLSMCGINIEEVVSTGIYEKSENKNYLETKRKKGHKL